MKVLCNKKLYIFSLSIKGLYVLNLVSFFFFIVDVHVSYLAQFNEHCIFEIAYQVRFNCKMFF